MVDFNEKLKKATSRIQEHVDQEKQTAEQERQASLQEEHERQELENAIYNKAMQFISIYIEPIMKQIQSKLPGGIRREYSERNSNFVGWSLEFLDDESFSLKVNFNHRFLWLSAEAHCHNKGTVYNERTKSFSFEQFNDSEMKDWIEIHAIKGYEAFGKNAETLHSSQIIVRYNKKDQGN